MNFKIKQFVQLNIKKVAKYTKFKKNGCILPKKKISSTIGGYFHYNFASLNYLYLNTISFKICNTGIYHTHKPINWMKFTGATKKRLCDE